MDNPCILFPIWMWFIVPQTLKLGEHGMNNQTSMHEQWQILTKTWKNHLEFIWKDFNSRSQWNKSHSIWMCISWYLIKKSFLFTITMKSESHEVRWMKKLEVEWKNDFICYNGVRRLSFLSLTLFIHFTHFDGKKNIWTHLQSSQLSQKSHKLSL